MRVQDGKQIYLLLYFFIEQTDPKIVIALYPFQAIEDGDLSLVKGEEYEVVNDSKEHWWQVKNSFG